MFKCRYSEQAALGLPRQMGRKTAVRTALSRRQHQLRRSKCSDPSRIKKTGHDPSRRLRMPPYNTRISIARLCSNSSPLSSVYHPSHRRRRASIVVLQYNRRHPSQRRILRLSFHDCLLTSSRQQSMRILLQRHFLPTSPSCCSRRQTNISLLHVVWEL